MTPPCRILLATGNPGKFREIAAILGAAFAGRLLCPAWVSLTDLPDDPPPPDENGSTFSENARLKALYYARRTSLWTIADDSGLEVDALDGQPGVLSARFAGVGRGAGGSEVDAANNRALIERLRGVPAQRRTARFRCAMVLADGQRVLAETEGVIEGRIVDEPRGTGGFGYDPHFYVERLGCTTAELPAAEKNRVSHRGQAARAMAERLGRLLAEVW